MYLLAVLPVISAFAGLSLAQAIDPDTVSMGDREQWCEAQVSSCPLLCLQYPGHSATVRSNTCIAKTLAYSCVCASGQTPNASEYSQTIPYFECTETNNRCVSNCNGDTTCQYNCRANNPCGAQNPKRVKTKTSTPASTPTSSASDSSNTDDSSSDGSSSGDTFSSSGSSGNSDNAGAGTNADGSSGAASLVLDLGRNWGLAVVLGGVFGGLAFAL